MGSRRELFGNKSRSPGRGMTASVVVGVQPAMQARTPDGTMTRGISRGGFGMLKSVRVPEPFTAPFERAETYVESLFSRIERTPEQGVLRVGGERYVLLR